MVLLELERIGKRYREGQRERIVLSEVSLQLDAGELAIVWGGRRSGRTTLLRVAAGIESPDGGSVRFEGRKISAGEPGALGVGIGYVHKTLRADEEQGVLEQVAAGPMARGVAVDEAREHAREALAKAGAECCAQMRVGELRGGEAARVAIARTLMSRPRLLIVDEPVATVELDERDNILTLLRGLAGEGMAVLASTGEPSELAGAHRALTLSDGRLRGPEQPPLAKVVALHGRV